METFKINILKYLSNNSNCECVGRIKELLNTNREFKQEVNLILNNLRQPIVEIIEEYLKKECIQKDNGTTAQSNPYPPELTDLMKLLKNGVCNDCETRKI